MTEPTPSTSFTHALHVASPVGTLELRASGAALSAIFMEPQGFLSEAGRTGGKSAVLEEAARQLEAYFAGKLVAFDLPIVYRGTELQEAVWRALLRVPFGATLAYSDIAAEVGRTSAVRAVGGAIGKNPIGIVVPCHRVVGKSGAITGYAGGVERKAWLLAHEGKQRTLLA